MMVHDGEYAFKNGRKKFEIEEWSIPWKMIQKMILIKHKKEVLQPKY